MKQIISGILSGFMAIAVIALMIEGIEALEQNEKTNETVIIETGLIE